MKTFQPSPFGLIAVSPFTGQARTCRQDLLIHLADLLGIHLEEATYLCLNDSNEDIKRDIAELESAREFSRRYEADADPTPDDSREWEHLL